MGMPPQDVSSPPSQGGDGHNPRMLDQQGGFPPGYTGYGGPAYTHSQYPPQGGFPGYGGQGYPPYGYPPPHMYPGYAPPPQYGYGGYPGYPSQQQQQARYNAEKPQEKGRRRSPLRNRGKSSPARGRADLPVSDAELEKQQQQQQRSVYESVSVKPMRTCFHFFVDDMQDKLRGMAQDEVRQSAGNLDPFLVNTNLNGRLMKLWEDSEASVREAYTKMEDEDRHRFMADDEVASRHCATLTARSRSPKIGEKKTPKQESESEGDNKKEDDDRKSLSPTENDESPTKKSRVNDEDVE